MGPKKRTRSTNKPLDETDNSNVCKGCNKEFKSVRMHLAKSKTNCIKQYTDSEYEFLEQESISKSQAKKSRTDAKIYASNSQKKENNYQYYQNKKNDNKEKNAQRYQKNKDNIARYYQENKEKIAKRYQENKEKVAKQYQIKKAEKQDNLKSTDRIKNFREDVIEGPNFVCCSCHRSLFKSGVKSLDLESLKTKYNLKEAFLQELGINNISNPVLCHNCLKIIRKKKFPSINVKNGLTLEEIPEELKLEDLEQQLIARNLLFIKVKRLRHGMRAFKDAIINVPLEDEDVEKNMTNLLPRHPDDAHLVCVQLKRKVEYNNSHLAGFIRPNIVLKALQTLKERGNKYYQHVIINENFMEKEEGSPE